MEFNVGIYKITNNIDNTIYIGASGNLKNRLKFHRGAYSKTKLHQDIRNIGLDNFSFEVLIFCELVDLDYFEKKIIEQYRKNFTLYNVQSGGLRYNVTDEYRNRLSSVLKGRTISNEGKENIRLAKLGDKNPNFGKRPSDETIAKMVASSMKTYLSDGVKFNNKIDIAKHYNVSIRTLYRHAEAGLITIAEVL